MIEDMNRKHDRRITGIDNGMMQRLMANEWPGNVRELRNTIERAVVLGAEGLLEAVTCRQALAAHRKAHRAVPDENAIRIGIGSTVDRRSGS